MKKRVFILLLSLFFLVGCGGNTSTIDTEIITTETEMHLVQFLGFDSSVISIQWVEEGEAAVAPIAPSVEGYQFTGWVEDYSHVTGDLLVSSNYQILRVTVNLVLHDGTLLDEIELDYGSSISLPIPVRDGYNFVGWFLGETFNSPRLYEGDKAYENLTLIARWQRMSATTVYTEAEFLKALSTDTCEEIHLGADITVQDTIIIDRSISIFGDGYKMMPKGTQETFNIELEGMSFPKKVEDIEIKSLNLYDLELVYDLPDSIVPQVFKIYEAKYFNINLDKVKISGDIQDCFNIDYSDRIDVLITNSDILVQGKAISLNEGFEINFQVENTDIEAGNIIYMNEMVYSRTNFLDSTLTMISANTEEYLALFVTEGSGDNEFIIKETDIYSKMLTNSYIVNAIDDSEGQYFDFDSCNIEINTAIYDDLFYTNNIFSHFNLDGTTLILKEGITEIPPLGFSQAYSVRNIILPSTLTVIGDYAFENCGGLISIIIPEGVTTIGDGAFAHCASLANVVIPYTVTDVGSELFYYASEMLRVYLFNEVDKTNWANDWKLDGKEEIAGVKHLTEIEGIKYLVLADDTAIAINFTYQGINELVIPETVMVEGLSYDVTEIGRNAFTFNSKISSVTIPKNVTEIGYLAFAECINLEEVNFASEGNLIFIDEGAFAYCINLREVTIPATVSDMGEAVFYNDYRLENVYFEPGILLTVIPENTFAYNERLSSIVIPATIFTIDYEAFYYCSNLTSVTFEEGTLIENINPFAFYQVSNLTTFTLPKSVSFIGDSAFTKTVNLTEFIIPEDSVLENIGSLAFSESGLAAIELPAGLTYIGSSAFNRCNNLTEINIPALVTALNSYAFFECSNLTNVTFSEGSVLSTIGYSAFYNDYSLVNIVLPDSVTFIGSQAFYNCYSLTTINIPQQLLTIDASAFASCTGLTSVVFGETTNLSAINYEAFNNCASLTEFFIPDTVTFIGGNAFGFCYQITAIYLEAEEIPLTWDYNWDGNFFSMIYYAVNHRTITLTLNNGEADVSIFEKIGTVLSAPTEPVRSGYTFAGWFEDDGTFFVPYTFSVMPEEDITIYAKWEPIP